ncbi:uncharacterized protein LTR77_004757 [Saxophila tyrrhenica]|uniref:Myb-like domain-containing protein n=1 Tax=Saxophila tyrrhenica TaxID=1690608 RepID=A0AAV9P9Z9_9PEZI|nr:hypothetical protein LTR77_004757 [Saxophila tyrrhenica]
MSYPAHSDPTSPRPAPQQQQETLTLCDVEPQPIRTESNREMCVRDQALQPANEDSVLWTNDPVQSLWPFCPAPKIPLIWRLWWYTPSTAGDLQPDRLPNVRSLRLYGWHEFEGPIPYESRPSFFYRQFNFVGRLDRSDKTLNWIWDQFQRLYPPWRSIAVDAQPLFLETKGDVVVGRWTANEKQLLIELRWIRGEVWKSISEKLGHDMGACRLQYYKMVPRSKEAEELVSWSEDDRTAFERSTPMEEDFELGSWSEDDRSHRTAFGRSTSVKDDFEDTDRAILEDLGEEPWREGYMFEEAKSSGADHYGFGKSRSNRQEDRPSYPPYLSDSPIEDMFGQRMETTASHSEDDNRNGGELSGAVTYRNPTKSRLRLLNSGPRPNAPRGPAS